MNPPLLDPWVDLRTMIGVEVGKAKQLLEEGFLVAIPTETVYGLAANAFDEAAVLNIFQAKNRPSFDPLIVHVRDRSQVDEVVSQVPPEAEALMAKFWPGPLTLVLPKNSRVPDIVTSGLDTVGVRMPAHAMALELLRSIEFPLAAPSANPFGYVSPTTAQHVADQLGDKTPYILDGGACTVGVESTIIGFEKGQCVLYRAGGIPLEDIEIVIGKVGSAQRRILPVAPGMIESHYAPRKPLIIGDISALLQEHLNKRCAVIAFNKTYDAWKCERLSPTGDLNEGARKLFAVMRSLDVSDVDLILAEVFPNEGLGRAINDRLRRASAKS